MVAGRTNATISDEERMVRRALALLARTTYEQPPPRIAEKLYPLLCECIGRRDPYEEEKRRCNDMGMALCDKLMERGAFPRALRPLVKLALAGNVIDYGVGEEFDLDASIERLLSSEPDVDEIDRFERKLGDASRVLYLADNAGELAFDRLLIEQGIGPTRVKLAVRGGPIINDATLQDAERVGLTAMVPVIEPGIAVPGIALQESNESFVKAFEEADLIVSKGQGNFETLEGYRDPRIFFVFMVKCRTLASLTGMPLRSSVAAFADRFHIPT